MKNYKDTPILVIEDDLIHLEIFNNMLNNLKYTNVSLASTYKEAAYLLEHTEPGVILIDYYLDKGTTGVDLIKEHLLNRDIPIIFISSFYNAELFNDIIEVAPVEYISKSASEFDLDKIIRISTNKKIEMESSHKIKEFIFVRSGKEIKKIQVDTIEYLTIDGKYVEIFVTGKRYLSRATLNDFSKKLPPQFIRIHQSYTINLKYLDSINVEEGTAKVGATTLPFSRNFKKGLFESYYMP